MHGLILRYDLIREKCISFNEETQKFIGGICMSKIFTWMFGFITGTVGGAVLMAVTMLMDPDRFIEILEYEKTHR